MKITPQEAASLEFKAVSDKIKELLARVTPAQRIDILADIKPIQGAEDIHLSNKTIKKSTKGSEEFKRRFSID